MALKFYCKSASVEFVFLTNSTEALLRHEFIYLNVMSNDNPGSGQVSVTSSYDLILAFVYFGLN